MGREREEKGWRKREERKERPKGGGGKEGGKGEKGSRPVFSGIEVSAENSLRSPPLYS